MRGGRSSFPGRERDRWMKRSGVQSDGGEEVRGEESREEEEEEEEEPAEGGKPATSRSFGPRRTNIPAASIH